mgnify:CR=1 FL=1
MAFEVQHHTICEGWVNTWSEEDEMGAWVPSRYATEAEADFELQEFLAEIKREVASGEREADAAYAAEEFRVVKVA